ncbi:MAG: AAA family ATPase [Candidatus Omnitrophota bacterium]
MYENYWNLTKKPFENVTDPEFFYFSDQHAEALSRLAYAIRERKGAALLTGVFGCGKTLLAQAILYELTQEKYKVGIINNPQLDYVDLLRAIVRSLKAVELPQKKTELSIDYLLEVLGKILENNLQDGKETVIIIDEAHVIEDKHVFEGIRMLLNFQDRGRFLITLILLGQPELRQKIEDNKQLEQRIAIKYHLNAFDLKDTINYIAYRLKLAGRDEAIFTKEAVESIYEYTGGIPRRINRLCDICLLAGVAKNLKQIDRSTVIEEARAL